MKGENCCKYTNNTPNVAFHFIGLQKRANPLVLGVHERHGFIDAIAQLLQMNEEVLTKKLQDFDTVPADIKAQRGFLNRFGSETAFVSQNSFRIAALK